MGIDNNLYEKSIKILTDLISFQTISGSDNTELISYCEKILNNLGIETFKVFDDEINYDTPYNSQINHLEMNLEE